MKRNVPMHILYALLCLLTFTFCQQSDTETVEMQSDDSNLPPNIQNMCFCSDSTLRDSLCSVIPEKVPLPDSLAPNGYTAGFDSLHQPYFDIFSWQAFVALNWPADASGKPIPGKFKTDNSSRRVWEYYADPDTVFGTSSGVLERHTSNRKAIYMNSKFGEQNFTFEESDGNFLIDQNLNYVVFEEKLNPIELAYIDSNGLRTQSGQQAFTQNHPVDLPPGSMELKASWRILNKDKDDWSRFYHQPATIYLDGDQTESGNDTTINAEIGLIGLHIVVKPENTNSFSDFLIWSTFEHIDNVPGDLQANQSPIGHKKDYNLYNPDCIGCEVNAPPSKSAKWGSKEPYAKKYAETVLGESRGGPFGTQVVRMYPVYYYTTLVNKVWREELKGSIWENYTLIGTQWGATSDGPPPKDTIMAPQYLANSSMETYEQQNSSCIKCHSMATIAGSHTIKADFSFLFGHAAKGVNSAARREEE